MNIQTLEEIVNVQLALKEIKTYFPEFTLGGSYVLQMNYSLNRKYNDLDIIVPSKSPALNELPIIKSLDFDFLAVNVHQSIIANNIKVDIMSTKEYWKVSSYKDHFYHCNVQMLDQVIFVIEYVILHPGFSNSIPKRLSDLNYINNTVKKWN